MGADEDRKNLSENYCTNFRIAVLEHKWMGNGFLKSQKNILYKLLCIIQKRKKQIIQSESRSNITIFPYTVYPQFSCLSSCSLPLNSSLKGLQNRIPFIQPSYTPIPYQPPLLWLLSDAANLGIIPHSIHGPAMVFSSASLWSLILTEELVLLQFCVIVP